MILIKKPDVLCCQINLNILKLLYMERKILIIGAKGMLGQDLANILSNFDLALWDKQEIEITDEYQVKTKINALNPDFIINCAAYTAVDDCEKNKDLSLAVNNRAIGYLAQTAKKNGAILIHISTDYVFNGQNKDGYEENSQAFGPVNFYGESKLLGEKTLQLIAPQFYLLRTSWLYGKNGKNFVETMIKLGKEQKELKVVNDQFGKPTYTVDLAGQILYILNNTLPFGIYHAVNETKIGGISWYEFARKIFELGNLNVKLEPCDSRAYPRPAKRPQYSALINTKLPPMRDWQDALADYFKKREKI